MQFMQMLKASLTSRRSLIATVVMVGVVASVMGLTPTHGASNTLAQDCANPPSTPTFNYWPVTYDDVNTPFCHDFPAIDASLDVSNPKWSKSDADWKDGLTLNAGDQGTAGLYIHNGAANNLSIAQTTAKNVHIITQTDTTVGADHIIKVTYTANNAAPYTRSFTVHTPADARLEVIPNSGFMYDYQGHVVLDSQNLNLGNSDYALGDLDACFEYSLFLTYKFKVIRSTPPVDTKSTLSITKSVRNTSRDGQNASYTSTVNAVKGDTVGYKVVVTNTSNTTAKSVTMTDNGVSGVTIDSGTVKVSRVDNPISGVSAPPYTGGLPGTLNLGDLLPGESRYITYNGTVNSTQCLTLTNTARAIATNAAEVFATASVVVINCNTSTGTPNIVLSKRAFNDTKNVDATTVTADRGDYITYSLVTTNNGNADQNNYVISDDLSQVLPLADMVSTNGGTMSGNTISYPSQTIRSGETVVKTFKVRIKQTLDTNLSYQLRNTYGNTIVINVPGKLIYQAPKTGAAGTSAGIFAGLVTAGFAILRKRDAILKFIFA